MPCCVVLTCFCSMCYVSLLPHGVPSTTKATNALPVWNLWCVIFFCPTTFNLSRVEEMFIRPVCFSCSAPHPTAGTLPLNTTPPQVSPRGSASLPRQPQHDSSSESDTPKSSKNQQKRSSTGLMGLFKRKKATQL